MTQALSQRLSNSRRFLPLAATIVMFGLVYAFGVLSFSAMQDTQPLFNLLNTAPFLLIAVVGQALVIISGGIDLSVGGVIALTTVAAAALLETGWDPAVVIVLMLLMGVTIGGVMGFFITYMKVQPFIATLAGMWFARGMCYLISDAEIRIYDDTWKTLAGIKVLIPGLADPVAKTGSYITVLVVIALVVLVAGLFLAHLTRFGRTLYAMGGNSGRNEQSARLMGLPVDRTKMQVYMVNGFCSALAGLVYSIYVGSGHGSHAMTMELTVIAAVVIGGVALTGGEGYVLGAFFGVLILSLIQSLILYHGQLSSWWTSIFIGLLMLLFIGVQSVLATLNARGLARAASGGEAQGAVAGPPVPRGSGGGGRGRHRHPARRPARAPSPDASVDGNGVVTSGAASWASPARRRPRLCEADGAVIVFEKAGGSSCVDQLFGVYPDGRVVGDDGTQQLEAQVEPEVVTALVANLEGLGWFTDDMYTTWHHPCGECYTYSVTVTSGDETKTIGAVDGGTDAPAKYWLATSRHLRHPARIERSSVMRLMTRGMIGLGALALGAVLAGCDYIVIPEQKSTPPPAEAEGVWTAVATNVEETQDGLRVDLAIRNDTGDWSAMEIAEGGFVSLVDASGSSRACGVAVVETGGTNIPPGFIMRGFTGGTRVEPAGRASPRRVRRGRSGRRARSSGSPTRSPPASSTSTGPTRRSGARSRSTSTRPSTDLAYPIGTETDLAVTEGGRADRGHQQDRAHARRGRTNRR